MSKKINILFLTHTSDPTMGGWGRYTYDLVSALRRKGYKVSTLDSLWRDVQNPLDYLRNPLTFLRDVFRIRKLVTQSNADVIHISVEPYVLFVPFLLPNKKIYMTLHGSYAYILNQSSQISRWFYKILFMRALSRISGLIAVSNFTRDYFEAQVKNVSCPPVYIIPNGIDVEAHSVTVASRDSDIKRILTVAPVKERKGIRESVEAVISFAKETDVEVRYHIVGTYDPNSSYFKEIDFRIRESGLEKSIIFRGRLSDEALRNEYAGADVFLMLPVIKDNNQFEGFGLVYLEANACGVPTIGSNIGGSAEAIDAGQSGILVNPYKTKEVVEALRAIVCTSMFQDKNPRDWATKHSVENVAKELISIYERD